MLIIDYNKIWKWLQVFLECHSRQNEKNTFQSSTYSVVNVKSQSGCNRTKCLRLEVSKRISPTAIRITPTIFVADESFNLLRSAIEFSLSYKPDYMFY